MRSSRLTAAVLCTFLLALAPGCHAVPGTYATTVHEPQADSPPDARAAELLKQERRGGYLPYSSAAIKPGFLNVLVEICGTISGKGDELDPSPDPTAPVLSCRAPVKPPPDLLPVSWPPKPPPECTGKSPGTDFPCWAARNAAAMRLVSAVTLHAVNQCVMLAGQQNRFAAVTNEFIFPIQSLLGAVADVTAVTSAARNASGSSATAALAAAVLTNSGDVQRSVPGTISMKVSDLTSNQNDYVLLGGFGDDDLVGIETFLRRAATPRSQGDEPIDKLLRSPLLLKYSRLHDAVLSGCPASNP